MNSSLYLPRPLPDALRSLAELALDVHWCWNHATDTLWQAIDPEMWEVSCNPWLMLMSASQQRLEELANDRRFCAELEDQRRARLHCLTRPAWFGEHPDAGALKSVAYFSLEFGLHEALPIYSGGLGILAGDHLKASSDLGVPVVGIGLLYQQGYFRQALDPGGNQLEYHPTNDPSMLPIVPLRNAGGRWLRVDVDLPGRVLRLRAWQVRIGRTFLYLLDSNDPQNLPGDRGITGELYGGDMECRLHQEIVLGIGGWQLLRALNLECTICHLNEAHGAFAVLERARGFMKKTGLDFHASLWCIRAGNIFTTHTPVAAGMERYPHDLIHLYFKGYAAQLGITSTEILAMGRSCPDDPQEPFNMSYLAFRGCGRVNAVSRSHGTVSRRLFEPLFPRWPVQEIPVGHVTSGVHVPFWESAAADDLWTIACGKDRWLGRLDDLGSHLRRMSDEALWASRCLNRKAMIESLQHSLTRQLAARSPDAPETFRFELNPNALTLGIGCQFTADKRPHLLLTDAERLARLLNQPGKPVQLIVAGKAHPNDEEGKRMVQAWARFMHHPTANGRMIFLEDFDMALAQKLVQGVDLWIHTPRRPTEASGTGGMKVLVNGGLNLSELDGWWAEAYAPDLGWAICEDGEYETEAEEDAAEAGQLLSLLEQHVIPSYYERDDSGLPAAWLARMRESMARLTANFSANRMLREYTEKHYLPGALAVTRRSTEKGALGVQLCQWQQDLAARWAGMEFGPVSFERTGDSYVFHARVYLGEMPPEIVQVELYADPCTATGTFRHEMARGEKLPGKAVGFMYDARVPADRPARDYTPRIIPAHPEAVIPADDSHCLWQR